MHAELRLPLVTAVVSALLATTGCYQGTRADPAATGEDGEGTADDGGDDGGSGTGDDGEDDGAPADGGIPACDASLVPDAVALRRLSRVQYDNTVHDLVAWALPPGDDPQAVSGTLAPLLAQVPTDTRQPAEGQHLGGFRSMDQAVQQQHVDAGYRVGRAVAAALTESPTRIEAIAGPCATDGDAANDDTCVDDFIRSFGERALRRPLFEDEVATYRAIFDADGVTQGTEPEAFADTIAAMMIAPSFMYMVEHGEAEVPELEGVYELSGWELASRLSYHFWQTSPDDALRQAAEDGSLRTEDGYAAQVDRLFEDPRSRQAVGTFYREWLWLDDVVPVDGLLGTPVYDAFVGDTVIDDQTHANMVQEVVDMVTYYTFDTDGSIEDLLLSDRSFATTPDVADIYGVAPWNGGEPPVLPHPERAGILGRAAVLSNRSAATRPIMKGVFIRTAVLCDEIPPPPPDAEMNVPEFDGEMTTREIVEELTEQPGSSCSGCHSTIINPLGYVSENFDALGRFRTEQDVYDVDGNVVATRPIDSEVLPGIEGGDDRTASNPRELAEIIVDSDKLRACFARNYLRFTFARSEDLEADACVLGDLFDRLNEGATLAETLRAIALRPEFRQRNFD